VASIKGDGDRQQDERGRCNPCERCLRTPLPKSTLAQPRQPKPDREIRNGAEQEERTIEVETVGQVRRRIETEPRIEARKHDYQRDQSQRQKPQATQAGGELRSDRIAPSPTGEGMDQQQREAAERPADPRHERREPGMRKVPRGDRPTGGGADQADCRDEQRRTFRLGAGHWSAPRSSCGASAGVAFWLSWSVRI
jgi:hypothetical protein